MPVTPQTIEVEVHPNLDPEAAQHMGVTGLDKQKRWHILDEFWGKPICGRVNEDDIVRCAPYGGLGDVLICRNCHRIHATPNAGGWSDTTRAPQYRMIEYPHDLNMPIGPGNGFRVIATGVTYATLEAADAATPRGCARYTG